MSQHWYDKNGKLFEVELKEARKLGLVPSVNTIIHEFDNSYGLDLYKSKQMFMSALTLPRPERITDEQFWKLALEDSQVHSEKAKEWGIKFHYKITDLLNVPAKWPPRFNPKILMDKKVLEVYDWLQANKDNYIVDFKTQETKNGKFKHYDSWIFQLCGYWYAVYHGAENLYWDQAAEFIDHSFSVLEDDNQFGGTLDYANIQIDKINDIKLINLIVSSNEDIPVKPYIWKPEKVEWGTKVFLKMVELYKILKKL